MDWYGLVLWYLAGCGFFMHLLFVSQLIKEIKKEVARLKLKEKLK